MKEREELRGGKPVTVVEKEEHDLTPEERQAAQDARIVALEVAVAELRRLLTPPAK